MKTLKIITLFLVLLSSSLSFAEYPTDERSIFEMFEQRWKKIKRTLFYPYSEDLVFVNDVLCHVGSYPHVIIYTVLEGAEFGKQTLTDPDSGEVVDGKHDFDLEDSPDGKVLHHHYDNAEVITGSKQVIRYYQGYY